MTLAELERADTAASCEAARVGRTQLESIGIASLPDASDDIAYAVKRRRLVGKQATNTLFVSIHVPRPILQI